LTFEKKVHESAAEELQAISRQVLEMEGSQRALKLTNDKNVGSLKEKEKEIERYGREVRCFEEELAQLRGKLEVEDREKQSSLKKVETLTNQSSQHVNQIREFKKSLELKTNILAIIYPISKFFHSIYINLIARMTTVRIYPTCISRYLCLSCPSAVSLQRLVHVNLCHNLGVKMFKLLSEEKSCLANTQSAQKNAASASARSPPDMSSVEAMKSWRDGVELVLAGMEASWSSQRQTAHAHLRSTSLYL